MGLKVIRYEVGFGEKVPINKYNPNALVYVKFKRFKVTELDKAKEFAKKINSKVEPVYWF